MKPPSDQAPAPARSPTPVWADLPSQASLRNSLAQDRRAARLHQPDTAPPALPSPIDDGQTASLSLSLSVMRLRGSLLTCRLLHSALPLRLARVPPLPRVTQDERKRRPPLSPPWPRRLTEYGHALSFLPLDRGRDRLSDRRPAWLLAPNHTHRPTPPRYIPCLDLSLSSLPRPHAHTRTHTTPPPLPDHPPPLAAFGMVFHRPAQPNHVFSSAHALVACRARLSAP